MRLLHIDGVVELEHGLHSVAEQTRRIGEDPTVATGRALLQAERDVVQADS